MGTVVTQAGQIVGQQTPIHSRIIHRRSPASLRRAVVIAGLTCAFALAVWLHVAGLNGPSYWLWRWLRRPNAVTIVIAFAVAGAPAVIAQAVFIRRRAIAVLLAMVSAVALQFAALSLGDTPAGERLVLIITDPAASSYFTAATQVHDLQQRQPEVSTVREFDRLLRFFPLHARTKPLLPVAGYLLLLRTFGPWTPIAAAALIALLTAGSIASVFGATRRIAGDEAAVIACCLFALMPALALFFPQLDVLYPLFTCGVLATWPRAVQGSRRDAAAFGLVVFVMTMTSYSLLVLGAFCVLLALFEAARAQSLRNVVIACAIGAAVTVAGYLVLSVATGYRAVRSFVAALAQQQQILPHLHRTYPLTIPFDLLDFALGAGWAPILAALFFVTRRERPAITAACLLTPLIVALSGLLQAETARVWIFLLPLVALPAAMEMTKLRPAGRVLVLASMILVSTALYTNMRFTWERPRGLIPRIPAGAFR
jgi:hypothetical protein